MWLNGRVWFRTVTVALIGFAFTGCALLPQPEIEPPTAQAPALPAVSAADTVAYRIEKAELIIHTYRDGWLSGMAHNHVMTTTDLQGDIHLAPVVESSQAVLYFRPYDLILDDPATRAAAGEGFESLRTAEDIAATRTRMLGPNGFDSNAYPYVVTEVGWLDRTQVTLIIEMRGERVELQAPVNWSLEGDRIRVSADFRTGHRALGLKPYSAFAGAIAVADPIRIQLKLSARR
jgi:hypothetical protein